MIDFLSPINAKQIKGVTYYGGEFIGDGSKLTGLDCPYDLAFALSDENTDFIIGESVQIYITRGFNVEKITVVVNEAPIGGNLKIDLKVKRNDSWNDVGEITINDGTTQASIISFDTEIFEDGDLLKAEIIQVGNTNAGSGAKIYIKGSMNGAMGGSTGVGNPKKQDLGEISGNTEIDLSFGTCVIATLTDSITLSFTGLPPIGEILEFTLNFTNIEEINWPLGTLFNGGAAMGVLASPYTYSCHIDSSGNLNVWGVAEWA